jgi:hypothetical protein
MEIKYRHYLPDFAQMSICPDCGYVYCNRDHLEGKQVCRDCGTNFDKLIKIVARYVDTSYWGGWRKLSIQQGHFEYRYDHDLKLENAVYLGKKR